MDLTTVFEALIALVAAIVTGVVVPYIRSRTTAQKREEIAGWVRVAVTAAEQIFTGSGRGEEKKTYVLEWLAEHGIQLDESKLDAMIEAAVYEINNAFLTVEGAAEATGE